MCPSGVDYHISVLPRFSSSLACCHPREKMAEMRTAKGNACREKCLRQGTWVTGLLRLKVFVSPAFHLSFIYPFVSSFLSTPLPSTFPCPPRCHHHPKGIPIPFIIVEFIFRRVRRHDSLSDARSGYFNAPLQLISLLSSLYEAWKVGMRKGGLMTGGGVEEGMSRWGRMCGRVCG